jgi:hypothetical protein
VLSGLATVLSLNEFAPLSLFLTATLLCIDYSYFIILRIKGIPSQLAQCVAVLIPWCDR